MESVGELSTHPGETQKPPRLLSETEQVRALAERFPELVVYEDEDILALNKPARVPTHRSPGHPAGVEEILAKVRSGAHPVHRLDIETSGLLLVGKTKEAQRKLQEQFAKRQVEKSYIALVDGDWDEKVAGIIAPLLVKRKVRVSMGPEAKKAATSFQEIAALETPGGDPKSLLRVEIYTGRTHQIRAHLRYLDFPITGDRLYNVDKLGFPRQLLHSYELWFNHPRTGGRMGLRAPLSRDFRDFVLGLKVKERTNQLEEVLGSGPTT